MNVDTYRLRFEIQRIRKLPISTLAGKVAIKLVGLILGAALVPVTALLHLMGYRHVNVFTDRIGHLAMEPDCLLKEQTLGQIRHKKWIVLAPPGRVANEHLLTYWRPHFRIFRNQAVCFLIASMSRWGLMRHEVSHYARNIGQAQAAYRVYTNWGDRPPLLKMSIEDKQWGAVQLRKLGLPDQAWFVCVHAREGGYSRVDEVIQNYRNTDIENTIPAISEIVRQGGWVIRIGDPSMKPLPAMPCVIDYAHDPIKSERLDLILCASARFLLGNTSGIAFLSTVFGVPCALTNMIPVSTLGFSPLDISIPKSLWSSQLKRFLDLAEILGTDVASYQYASQYENSGLRIVENSSEDILGLTIEMLDRLSGKIIYSAEDEQRLASIRALFSDHHYAFASRASFGRSFLRDHTDVFPSSRK